MTAPTAVLVPPPALARSALPDALELVAGLRPLDPLAAPALVAPAALRERLKAPLEALGFARVTGALLDEHTPAAGVRPDAAARLLKAPHDVYQLTAAARPLASLGLTPETARAQAREAPGLALVVERLARERDLEAIVLILERTRDELPPVAGAFVRHRVALVHADTRALELAARALKADAPAGIALAAREALGFAARLLLPESTHAQGFEGAVGRELDLFLADALIEAATPAGPDPIDELDAPPGASFDWPGEVVRTVLHLRDPGKPDDPASPIPRSVRAALELARAFATFRAPEERRRLAQASAVVGSHVLAPDAALALALSEKHVAGLAPAQRRRHYRSFAHQASADARRLVESALPELAGLDRLIDDGIAAGAKASSRAELVSSRRRACALALARTAEVAAEERSFRGELERARALLDTRIKQPARPARRETVKLAKTMRFAPVAADVPGADELDWELVALGVEEALLAPDADRAALASRSRVALESWVAVAERAPLGFLAPALRLLSSHEAESPFPGESKDPRRFEARVLFHLSRRALRGDELPRELVETLLERRRSGLALADLARKLDPTVSTSLLFEALPREVAARLADELGPASELRLVRRLDGGALLGRLEHAFVRVRFFPEDDPPLERARSLVRPGAEVAGGSSAPVSRPLAALDAARVRGGLGVGWALACAHVEGARLAPEDVPQGEDALGFVAKLSRAFASQHAWGLVHGSLRLDEIVVTREGELAFSDFDLEASLAPDLAPGRARDLEALLHSAGEIVRDANALVACRAKAGDLGAEGAATRLADALESRAVDRGALERLRMRRVIDRTELRGLLRDALSHDALPRSLAEVEGKVPGYLPYRAAVDQAVVRDELLALAEEGWASGEFSLEIDARRGVFRLVQATP